MTSGEYIYRKTVDYMSRMALEKYDFRTFLMIWEFRVTGNSDCQTNSPCQFLHKKWDPRECKEDKVENMTDNVRV